MMKDFELLKIHADYTGIKIGMEEGVSFDFIIKMSYAGFSYDQDNINYIKRIEKSTSKYFEGYVNKENSNSKIEITSDYGSVKLYNN